jgi:hypothetical protein
MIYEAQQLSYFLIAANAYDELLMILNHPEFRIKEAPKTYKQLTSFRKGPLLQLSGRPVTVNTMAAPSNTTSDGIFLSFSLIDHIKRFILNNSIRKHLYFGSGIETMFCTELWHGELWQEHPLIGADHIILDDGQLPLLIYHHIPDCG